MGQSGRTDRRGRRMSTTDTYTNEVLSKAQELLWGGSETENIEAHNMIAKLINDRMNS